jgi:hypothetical protein
MCDGPFVGRVNATDVEDRLADAGRVLLTLPWSGCFPAGFRSLWPDQVGPSSWRRMPTSREISAMDEAYRWTSFITDQDERRLVLMRSLIFEDAASGRPRYVWTWRRLRRTTGLHPDTLKTRWGRGIDRIVRGLNQPAHRCDSRRSDGFPPGSAGKPADGAGGGLQARALGSLTGHMRQNHAIRRA